MNLQKYKTELWLGLILLLALALRLPGWFTQDEKSRFRLFEPDEYQHVEIAVYQIQCIDSSLLQDWDVERKMFNARGYGIQLGCLAWLNYRIWGMTLNPENIILLGRMLSTTYALLSILLIYYFGRLLFGKREVALMAALLLAICDLNVTSSHYAIPAASYIFWVYLFVGAGALWLRQSFMGNGKKQLLYVAFMAWTASAAFAAKFDFIPLVVGLGMIPLTALLRKLPLGRALLLSMSFLLMFGLSFGLQTTFNFTLERIHYSFWDLYRQNKDVIPVDSHRLFNPIVYLIGVIAATSLPVAAFGGLGIRRIWKDRAIYLPYLLLFLAVVLLESGVRWSSDVPFIRRANIFMPPMVLLAAYGWDTLTGSRRKWWAMLMVLYTLGLCLISQSNAWWDSRYAARRYLLEELADRRIKYGSYAHAVGMPPGVSLQEKEDILVLHEAFYGRYWRSFTTPFRIPTCCDEVYHCEAEHCQNMQLILAGTHPDYRLLKAFRTREYFPERVLFKKYLGNFETFLGDVLVLERIN